MRTWRQAILNTTIGKVAGTWDNIGTITVRKGVRSIHGFYALLTNSKPTADEASTPTIRVNSSDLGVSNLELHGGRIGAEGMAAHQATMTKKVWYPWAPSSTRSLEFSDIVFDVTSIIANTEGWDCAIELVTGDAPPTEKMQRHYESDSCGGFSDGNYAIEAAGAGDSATLAGWGATDADMVVINAKNNSIVGIAYTIGLNGETSAVPLVDYADITNSDIDNFSPQQHVVQYGANGSLGTVINAINEPAVKYLPFVFDGLPSDKVKCSIADINSLTGLNAGDGLLAMVFK